jgi:acetyl-CoA C-acetyltransferase
MAGKVYVLGGYQTDFARHWGRERGTLFELLSATVEGALESAQLDPSEVQSAHVGNFTGELFSQQGQLGGFFASLHPSFAELPTARHEAACASGSVALLAAASEIEAGRYELSCVVGLEQMRHVPGEQAAAYLGAAAWHGREAREARYVWPHLFSQLTEEYERRYGLDHKHLMGIAKINFDHARRNPNAQTRTWRFSDRSFTADDEQNPIVEGRLRRHDCGQITDGGAAVFLASERAAGAYARRRNIPVDSLPTLEGWGHRTAPMLYERKIADSAGQPLVFPHVRRTIEDAWRRAGGLKLDQIDGIELHDCFTITEYMAIDHFGLTPPGESWRAIESGEIALGGRMPINPSGGLIGLGHPVGATGVRMVLDAYKQVTGRAGAYQVEGARRFQTLNIGGSTTTVVSFIVGR